MPACVRHQGARGSLAGRDRGGPVGDRFTPLAGKDSDHPHRRGPRLPRLAHPAPPKARNRQAIHLHLPGQEILVGHHGKGEDDLPDEQKQTVSSPDPPAQPGVEGLVRPLPARGVQSDLRLPAQGCVAPGHALATPQARQRTPGRLEGHPPTLLRRWMVAPRWRGEALQPGAGAHHPLFLPGNQNSLTMA